MLNLDENSITDFVVPAYCDIEIGYFVATSLIVAPIGSLDGHLSSKISSMFRFVSRIKMLIRNSQSCRIETILDEHVDANVSIDSCSYSDTIPLRAKDFGMSSFFEISISTKCI